MKSNLKKLFLSAFVLMISLSAMAQGPSDPPGEDDPPAAPINKYLVWFGIIAIAYTFFYIKNSYKKAIK